MDLPFFRRCKVVFGPMSLSHIWKRVGQYFPARSALALTASILVTTPPAFASQAPNAASFLELGRTISAPDGAAQLCNRYEWACHPRRLDSDLPRNALRLAARVNRQVNASINATTDMAQYGRAEHWSLPTRVGGDCEDFALQKKLELLRRGIPARAMMIATVHSNRIGAHAVLILRLNDGDYVLDNLSNGVRRWHTSPYTFLRVQDPNRPGQWRSATRPSF